MNPAHHKHVNVKRGNLDISPCQTDSRYTEGFITQYLLANKEVHSSRLKSLVLPTVGSPHRLLLGQTNSWYKDGCKRLHRLAHFVDSLLDSLAIPTVGTEGLDNTQLSARKHNQKQAQQKPGHTDRRYRSSNVSAPYRRSVTGGLDNGNGIHSF